MNILGIETSCDETSAAVVKNGKTILSNIVATSLKEHAKYGGVIPEIASRRQIEYIYPVVEQALKDANCSFKNINAIAVTKEPGLIGSLLVGTSFANALSFSLKKPLINVNHIKAHIHANFLSDKNEDAKKPPIKFPAIGLIVSGGHTSLYLVKDFEHYELLGKTLDDAAGEAYDKIARIMNLGYPGGPIIDKLASQGKASHIKFNSADLPGTFNFSFSGVKTSVLYYFQKHQKDSDFTIEDIAYAFQNSVVSILIKKTLEACQMYKVKSVLVGGGVAANSALRKQLTEKAEDNNIKAFFPPLKLCLDNAAMIAGYGFHQLRTQRKN